MKWDKFGLPYEDQEGDDSLMILSLYFINLLFFKKALDLDFATRYPLRARLEDEPLDDYDGYLTSRVQAYNQLLAKQNLTYIEECDINFHHKITGCMYIGQLQIHPVARYREMNFKNLATALAALHLFDFEDISKVQNTRNLLLLAYLKNRKNIMLNILSDTLLLGYSIVGNVDTAGALLVASKKSPTFITKLINKVYSFRQPTRLWSATLNG
jgi:hypothetical protein